MIDPATTKSLYKAIEKLNRPLDQVDLLILCNSNKEIFGEKGGDKRRSVQKFFGNIKRRSARTYERKLLEFGIPPSDATRAWIAQEDRNPSPDSATTTLGEEVSMNGGDGGGGDDVSEMTNMFQNNFTVNSAPQQHSPYAVNTPLKRESPPSSSPIQHSPYTNNSFHSSPPQTMVNNQQGNLFTQPAATVPRTPQKSTGTPITQGSPNFSTSSAFSSPEQAAGVSTQFGGGFAGPPAQTQNHHFGGGFGGASTQTQNRHYHEGSRENPEVIYINLQHPERNGRFDVKVNSKRVCNGVARHSLHLQSGTGPKNVPDWSATLDNSNPAMFGRVILVQGPSRDSYYSSVKSVPSPDGSDINDAHAEADYEIASDPTRKTKYWRLILPEGWELDNLALSDHMLNINKKFIVTTDVVEGYEFNQLLVQWEIAKRDGARITAQHKNENISLGSIFGKK
ncbi:unnamed protein product [Cylindrotheca closterium]|uniref:Uncharacterized protein n=1 Tax=Cylindrotheca closterium TaxID=2856 RepID=A0AAD2CJ22_9STRA|nr:unnamed protein product [Cylindrotheca closterium]